MVSGDIFCNSTEINWVEARDAVKHHTTHRAVSYNKNDLIQNVNGAGVEKS